jgi:hypothetical protein
MPDLSQPRPAGEVPFSAKTKFSSHLRGIKDTFVGVKWRVRGSLRWDSSLDLPGEHWDN